MARRGREDDHMHMSPTPPTFHIDEEAWKKMPLFMDQRAVAKAEENSAVSALVSLFHEDSTPEEMAERCKSSGNQNFRMGLLRKDQDLIRSALHFYSKGLDIQGINKDVKAILYSNRSQAQLYLRNNLFALSDAEHALALDPYQEKAYYRAAMAASRLSRFEFSLFILEKGENIRPEWKDEFKTYKKEIFSLQQKQRKKKRQRASSSTCCTPCGDRNRTYPTHVGDSIESP